MRDMRAQKGPRVSSKKKQAEKKKFKIGRGRGIKRNNLFVPKLNEPKGLPTNPIELNSLIKIDQAAAMGSSFHRKSKTNPGKIYAQGSPRNRKNNRYRNLKKRRDRFVV